jgi:hypothetical protein
VFTAWRAAVTVIADSVAAEPGSPALGLEPWFSPF